MFLKNIVTKVCFKLEDILSLHPLLKKHISWAISALGSEYPDFISGGLQLPKENLKKGRLAQLVQSIWFTPRGSGVRISHRPQTQKPVTKSRKFIEQLIGSTRED